MVDRTKFVTLEDDDIVRLVHDIVEIGDHPSDEKRTRTRIMRQFGLQLNQLLRGEIHAIMIERE